jgi:hypothetical protein
MITDQITLCLPEYNILPSDLFNNLYTSENPELRFSHIYTEHQRMKYFI